MDIFCIHNKVWYENIYTFPIFLCIPKPTNVMDRNKNMAAVNVDYGHNPGDGGSISLLMSQRPRSKYKADGISYHNGKPQCIDTCPFHIRSIQNWDNFLHTSI